MKKSVILIFLFVGTTLLAQQSENFQRKKPNFSLEQKAELISKRLALTLDLDQKQILQVKELELQRQIQNQKWREARNQIKTDDWEKPTEEELFKMKSAQLDRQIAFQGEMKKILTTDQYEKWKENNTARMEKKQAHRREFMRNRNGMRQHKE